MQPKVLKWKKIPICQAMSNIYIWSSMETIIADQRMNSLERSRRTFDFSYQTSENAQSGSW